MQHSAPSVIAVADTALRPKRRESANASTSVPSVALMANGLAITALVVAVLSAMFTYKVYAIEKQRRVEEVESGRRADIRLSLTSDRAIRGQTVFLVLANEGEHA